MGEVGFISLNFFDSILWWYRRKIVLYSTLDGGDWFVATQLPSRWSESNGKEECISGFPSDLLARFRPIYSDGAITE